MQPLGFWGPTKVGVETPGPFALVDVTDAVAAAVAAFDMAAGAAQVYCPHTSCGLAITEMEDGLHQDLEGVLDELAPTDREWIHDDMTRRWQNLEPDERRNGWSHMRALLATLPTVTLPVEDGELSLGRWQRLFLVELDGPRSRTLAVQGWGEVLHPSPSPLAS